MIFIVLIILYSVLIFLLAIKFANKPSYNAKTQAAISVSVIVAFKNEEKNIEALINYLKAQNYNNTLTQYILVNDNSTDNSFNIAVNKTQNDNRFTILNLENNKGKKQALKYGLNFAKNELIIHTDTDVVLNKNWINTIAKYYTENDFILALAPVIYKNEKSIFQKLQSLEIVNIAGITAGSAILNAPLMANGANLAYKNELIPLFIESINSQASGDDMFFLEKVKTKYPKNIEYIKSEDAVVYTFAENSFSSFLSQRLRWFGKSSSFKNPFIVIVGLFTGLINLISVFGVIAIILFPKIMPVLLIFYVIKFITELFTSIIYAKYFKKTNLIYLIPLLFLVYPFYVIIVGASSLLFTPRWK